MPNSLAQRTSGELRGRLTPCPRSERRTRSVKRSKGFAYESAGYYRHRTAFPRPILVETMLSVIPNRVWKPVRIRVVHPLPGFKSPGPPAPSRTVIGRGTSCKPARITCSRWSIAWTKTTLVFRFRLRRFASHLRVVAKGKAPNHPWLAHGLAGEQSVRPLPL